MQLYIIVIILIIGNIGFYLRIQLGGGFTSKKEKFIGFLLCNVIIIVFLIILYFFPPPWR